MRWCFGDGSMTTATAKRAFIFPFYVSIRRFSLFRFFFVLILSCYLFIDFWVVNGGFVMRIYGDWF
jgi:hypothetical protein